MKRKRLETVDVTVGCKSEPSRSAMAAELVRYCECADCRVFFANVTRYIVDRVLPEKVESK